MCAWNQIGYLQCTFLCKNPRACLICHFVFQAGCSPIKALAFCIAVISRSDLTAISISLASPKKKSRKYHHELLQHLRFRRSHSGHHHWTIGSWLAEENWQENRKSFHLNFVEPETN